MLADPITFAGLTISASLLIILLTNLSGSGRKTQLYKFFSLTCLCMLTQSLALIAQILFSPILHIHPIKFEYIAYIGVCFMPVCLYFTSVIFANTKIKFKKSHLLFCVVPMITLIVIWTNDFHHLFYKNYSININETGGGPYTNVHFIYTYGLFALSLINFLRYSIKNAGFFSKQSMLILLGAFIPIAVNLLGTFNIIPMTIYVTPICFPITITLFASAILKFKFLSSTPIAMQKIVDRMSDSFLVVGEDGKITDFNETFLKTFKFKSENVRNVDFINFISSLNLDANFFKPILEKTKSTSKTILVKQDMQIEDAYFNIEASGIFSNGSFVGTLILIKDVTQHTLDMKTITENQNMLMEKERLASLGQLIGGIAHNLKTPIMSIAGAAEGLNDLVKEYDASIGDPEVTNDDHHAIANDMEDWIVKVKEYTEYMSDVITAVKGQAVTFSDDESVSFDIDELLKRVNILMRHELKSSLINLNFKVDDPHSVLHGNINSLVQVINNMVSNAIQAYDGKTGEDIDLIVKKEENNIIISIVDYASGLSKEVQDKLFKEMITTKGKNGTGLGLFMSYSTIRANFNGNITFESELGKGTTFNIILPA